MTNKKSTFIRDFLVQGAPAVIAALAAYFASEANKSSEIAIENSKIKQARIEERDRIPKLNGYMIPTSANALWSNYLSCRKRAENNDRVTCSNEAKSSDLVSTPELVGKPLK